MIVRRRPRDGAVVEIVALQARVVRWLSELHDRGEFSHDGVEVVTQNDGVGRAGQNDGTEGVEESVGVDENGGIETATQRNNTTPHLTTHWTYSEWFQRIASHFESAFFIPGTDSQGAYYRDCYNKTHRDEDDALRPNYVHASLVRLA